MTENEVQQTEINYGIQANYKYRYAWAEKPKIEVPKQEDIYRFSKKEAK